MLQCYKSRARIVLESRVALAAFAAFPDGCEKQVAMGRAESILTLTL